VLTPGRYVGAEDVADDGEAFADKMARLTAQLKTQFEESDRLEAEIKKNLAGLGYESEWTKVKISEVCDMIVDCVNTAPQVEYKTLK
jgi:hypothetical protein